ncbi:hypothetical protein CES86_0200 [Brucella lupini]|uniref:Uncharacterized protein n=1 Tax=Brucella lupini TaxID=255457 RepID=A0A256GZR0_9HYPH|nr:hypothetical protein CES86_0200 [Brucella lupini]
MIFTSSMNSEGPRIARPFRFAIMEMVAEKLASGGALL